MTIRHYRAVVYLDVEASGDDTAMGIEAGLTQALNDIIPDAVTREAPEMKVFVADVRLRYEPIKAEGCLICGAEWRDECDSAMHAAEARVALRTVREWKPEAEAKRMRLAASAQQEHVAQGFEVAVEGDW